MNLRFLHFGINFTLLTALLAQCLALPSTLSPRADGCTEGFKVIISNNRTGDSRRGKGDSELHAYVSGQVDDKYGMLVWEENTTTWWPLEAGPDTSASKHEMVELPTGKSLAKPIGNDNVEFCMPKNIISGRVYIVEGKLEFKTFLSGNRVLVDEPSAVANATDAYNKRWSFLEFTYKEEEHIIVNPSFVDWVSLTLGFTLTTSDETHKVPGLVPDSLRKVCDGLKNQSRTDQIPHWERLCVYRKDSQDLLRVLSPNQYARLHPGAWKGYYDSYWEEFGKAITEENPFTINTQDNNGKKVADGNEITCKMPDKALLCTGTTKPPKEFEIGPPGDITEIWGCDGGMFNTSKYGDPNGADIQYLEILPRLCAAMVRSTLLLRGGLRQPNKEITSDKYYNPGSNKDGKDWPTNHYSRIVHEFLREGKGYAFAYDDVSPDGEESAGLIDTFHPETWNITLSD